MFFITCRLWALLFSSILVVNFNDDFHMLKLLFLGMILTCFHLHYAYFVSWLPRFFLLRRETLLGKAKWRSVFIFPLDFYVCYVCFSPSSKLTTYAGWIYTGKSYLYTITQISSQRLRWVLLERNKFILSSIIQSADIKVSTFLKCFI